jgi:hypothetical protein
MFLVSSVLVLRKPITTCIKECGPSKGVKRTTASYLQVP